MPRNCTERRLSRSGGLGLGARDLGHRPQAVEDPARQADRARELVVDVDRVEVARRARVANGQVAVGSDLQVRQPLAGVHHSPLTMQVHLPVQTRSPRWLSERDSNT
jgi:hypothetical protein